MPRANHTRIAAAHLSVEDLRYLLRLRETFGPKIHVRGNIELDPITAFESANILQTVLDMIIDLPAEMRARLTFATTPPYTAEELLKVVIERIQPNPE